MRVADLVKTLKYGAFIIECEIDNKLYDVEEFYYDDEICEYVMKLTGGYEYESE